MDVVSNKRILIVEDNALIGGLIADVITDAGGWPIGPALNEREALDMIDDISGSPDAVVLDLQFDGTSLNVARRLRELAIPFIYATGNRNDVPAEFAHHAVCEKPYTAAELLSTLKSAFEPRHS